MAAADESAPNGPRLGITTPVVTMLPDAHAAWEREGTIEDIAAVARAAERFGYDYVTCSEHVMIPTDVAAVRGSRYWDPLATFGYLAAVTERLRFATNVLVLGYNHPLAIAKRYGTLDQVTGGRVILGLGVGSLEEEFDLLGAEFADRGPRADDAIRALRASLSPSAPPTGVRTTASTTWWSIPVPSRNGCRCGSEVERRARCDAPWSSATGGCRSASAPPHSAS